MNNITEDAPLLWRDFPDHVLPEPIRSFVRAQSEALGCYYAFVAMPALAAMAAAIGTARRIRLKDTWLAPSVVWTAIVAESGSLKSPALEAALKPLRKVQNLLFAEHEMKIRNYKKEQIIYKAKLENWRKKADGDPPEEPSEPTCIRHIVSDITIEALAPILRDNPRGVLAVRDEISAWISSFDAYHRGAGRDVANWIEIFHARELTVDRKSGDERTIHVPRAAASVTGTIQPEVLRNVLRPDYYSNGFVARLLLAMPPRKPKKWTEKTVSKELLTKVDHVFNHLLNLEFDQNYDDPVPIDIPMSREASDLWEAFYNEISEEQVSVDPELAASLSKLEEYAARFALIFALTRHAASASHAEPLKYIDGKLMRGGIELVRWLAREQERVYGALNEHEEERQRRDLISFIQGKGGAITVRDLNRGPRCYRGEEGKQRAEEELETLVAQGIARKQNRSGEGPGRPVVVYELIDDEVGVDEGSENNSDGDPAIVSPSPPVEPKTESSEADVSDAPPREVLVSPDDPEKQPVPSGLFDIQESKSMTNEDDEWGEL